MRTLFFFALFLSGVIPAYAYTLPYPSSMPGSRFYGVSRLFDKARVFWYWGPIAKYKYHAYLSDKYLVEAKILFEYQQYLLAIDALNRSNKEILMMQERNGDQLNKHRKVLMKLKNELPPEFFWQPEKQDGSLLRIHNLLNEAILLRND